MRTTVDDKKRICISDLVEARKSIFELAQAFSPELEEQPCIGFWVIKDLIAHLIGWDKTNIAAIAEILDGKYPSFFRNYDKDWKTYNELLVASYKKPTLAELVKDAEASHCELIAMLEALPATTLVKGKATNERGRSVTITGLLRAEAADEQKHAEQVRAFLQQQNSSG